jgi:hypothetical protein
MPVHTGKDSKGCFAQWGSSGKKYYYTCGNDSARKGARAKAAKQGAAAHASGYQGNKEITMLNGFRKVTANFAGLTRHDKMEGRDFIVAPMIMIVEGVHEGSEGALLYPAEELSKTPAVWNHKPIVVYHPERDGRGISACDPDVLTNRKVGVIMNTSFEGDKLKAEAWLEVDRMNAVDDRIASAVEKQEMMELSTGLFTDNEKMEGEWNGEEYLAIARNYRPDHLALLPDLKGACSIEDGAGFLRLNEMGHGSIRSLLSTALHGKAEDVWIEEVYGDFFIYENDGKLYKQSYEEEEGKITITGNAVEVVRIIEYHTTEGAFVASSELNAVYNRKEDKMKKEKIVDGLIANKSTRWKEEDKETLMGLEKKVLENMVPVENVEDNNKAAVDAAAQEGGKDVAAASQPAESATTDTATEAKAEEKVEPPAENMTAEDYINKAPAELQGVLRNGLKSYNANKVSLIKIITANEKNQFTKEQLEAKDLGELQALAILASDTEEEQQEVNTLNFRGQGPIVEATAEDEEPLPLPSINYEKQAG